MSQNQDCVEIKEQQKICQNQIASLRVHKICSRKAHSCRDKNCAICQSHIKKQMMGWHNEISIQQFKNKFALLERSCTQRSKFFKSQLDEIERKAIQEIINKKQQCMKEIDNTQVQLMRKIYQDLNRSHKNLYEKYLNQRYDSLTCNQVFWTMNQKPALINVKCSQINNTFQKIIKKFQNFQLIKKNSPQQLFQKKINIKNEKNIQKGLDNRKISKYDQLQRQRNQIMINKKRKQLFQKQKQIQINKFMQKQQQINHKNALVNLNNSYQKTWNIINRPQNIKQKADTISSINRLNYRQIKFYNTIFQNFIDLQPDYFRKQRIKIIKDQFILKNNKNQLKNLSQKMQDQMKIIQNAYISYRQAFKEIISMPQYKNIFEQKQFNLQQFHMDIQQKIIQKIHKDGQDINQLYNVEIYLKLKNYNNLRNFPKQWPKRGKNRFINLMQIIQKRNQINVNKKQRLNQKPSILRLQQQFQKNIYKPIQKQQNSLKKNSQRQQNNIISRYQHKNIQQANNQQNFQNVQNQSQHDNQNSLSSQEQIIQNNNKNKNKNKNDQVNVKQQNQDLSYIQWNNKKLIEDIKKFGNSQQNGLKVEAIDQIRNFKSIKLPQIKSSTKNFANFSHLAFNLFQKSQKKKEFHNIQ